MEETNSTDLSRRGFLRATGAAGAGAALATVAGARGDDTSEGGDGGEEMIVGVSADTELADVERELPDELEVVRRNESLGFVVARHPGDAGVYDRMRTESTAATIPAVKYTERNVAGEIHGVRSGPAETGEAGLADDPKLSEQYAPQQVDAPAAWTTTRGSDDVTVAVVDMGVAYDHPDLVDRFDDLKGKDFGDDDDDPYPPEPEYEQHGTHVAGIAAATTGNGTGIAGVSNSRLLSCRVAGGDGQTWAARTADALQWAADQGADVINMSLGHPSFDTQTMRTAVTYATNRGALVLASAGNDYREGVSYPAAFDDVVAVSALGEGKDHAEFANYGENVDVTGPGVDVLSCNSAFETADSDHIQMSGTSMSSPAVAGVAALGKAVDPDLTVEELRQQLKETAADVGLSDKKQGGGLADAGALVEAVRDDDANDDPSAAFSVDASADPSDPSLSVDARGAVDPDDSIESFEWTFGDGATATGETASHAYDERGEYEVTLTVTGDGGGTDTARKTVGVGLGDRCGTVTETREESGELTEDGEKDTYTHEVSIEDPCGVTVSLTGDDDMDCDLYLTRDGREPATDDYDRASLNYGPDEEVALENDDLYPGTELGLMVHAYEGTGEYTLTVAEEGTGGAVGDNEGPTAELTAHQSTEEGEPVVTLDASESRDPDGTVVEHEWSLWNGETRTGEEVTVSPDPGEYEVTLTVTDDRGATASTTETVSVAGAGCGDATETTVRTGELAEAGEGDVYTYGAKLDDPCGATVSLTGDDDLDCDLYLTLDGREPTTDDYDRASLSYGPDEAVALADDAIDADTELGVLVHDYRGSGEYTLTVTESGRTEDDCGSDRETDTIDGALAGGDDAARFSHVTLTPDPCRVVLTLSGPADADFDLYATADGTTPTPDDHDYASTTPNSDERIAIDDVDESSVVEVLVDAWSGEGEFTLSVEELGK